MDSITTLPRLTKEQFATFMGLLARGYTARMIRKHMDEEHSVVLSDAQILYAGVQYAAEIQGIRLTLDKMTLRTGLARSEERIRRLSELADSWEDKARGDQEAASTRAAQVYVRTLEQIQKETDALGLHTAVSDDDPWVTLLNKLKPEQPTLPPSTGEPPEGQTNSP